MKKTLLTVATLLAISTGAMAADFSPKNELNGAVSIPKKDMKFVENNYNEETDVDVASLGIDLCKLKGLCQ